MVRPHRKLIPQGMQHGFHAVRRLERGERTVFEWSVDVLQTMAGDRQHQDAAFRDATGKVAQGSRLQSRHFSRPATEAALPGSMKMPSFAANHAWASRISWSVTISMEPLESRIAALA